MLIAAMYPCPFDAGSSHDYSFGLVRLRPHSVSDFAPFALPASDVYAYEEGKCNTEKHAGLARFPYRSLAMGFAELGESPEKVTKWVFPTPSPTYDTSRLFEVLVGLKALPEMPAPSEQQQLIDSGFVQFVPHQEAHAGLAAFTSPFREGFFFTLDGGGDPGDPRDSIFGTFGASKGMALAWEATASRQSLAWFHERLTEYLGFNQLDNGKVTGLAAYGTVRGELLEYFADRVRNHDPKSPQISLERLGRSATDFSRASLDNFALHRLINPAPGNLQMVHDLASFNPLDVAASGEQFFREAVTSAVLSLLAEFDVPRNGCFSGGVFNNVRLNQELAENPAFRSHFSMAPGDAGLALGAALVAVADGNERRVRTALIGPSFSRTLIERTLDEFRLPRRQARPEDVAELIADGAIVGWFQGRAEYGPRSLGARSILGDPRDPKSKARLNQLAKRRDFFMPFAPAVMSNKLSSVVKGPEADPYMQVSVELSEEGKALIPAAVHVDGTSRVQAVDPDINPLFHEVIEAFWRVTGVPALLNTSFNRHGISTISTPRAAIEHLLSGCVEHLYLDGYLVSRSDFVADIPPESELAEEDMLLERLVSTIQSKHATAASRFDPAPGQD